LSDWKTVFGQRRLVKRRQRAPEGADLARRGRVQRRGEAEQAALAAARRADDPDQLSLGDLEVEAAEGNRLGRAGAVDLEDVVELERGPIDALLLGLDVESSELGGKVGERLGDRT